VSPGSARGLLLGALLGGCTASSPVEAVRAFSDAAQAGAQHEVWRLLGPKSRERVVADAKRAAELSGRRALLPESMLAVGWSAPRFRAAEIRERSVQVDHALVEVRGPAGEMALVDCVLEGGAWKVELPPPRFAEDAPESQ
jgi:hypothetical protein